jgi:CRP/FNR family transcriptional regulator, anaerobic regulatory protein
MLDIQEYARTTEPVTFTARSGSLAAHTPATHVKTQCSNCGMRGICMPFGLSATDFSRLDAIVRNSRTVRRGETLFRAGTPFSNIYAVRTGSFKTVARHRDGREQVTGFHIAGEPLGLDGVCSETHVCDAVALEDSSICVIPFHLLEVLCREISLLQQHVHKMMSGEIVREAGLMMLLGNMCAQERVATFLLNMSQRLAVRGYSSSEFILRMTREEIGSYLGLKLETISRMLSRFQKQALIRVEGKQIRLLDIERLGVV